MDWTRGAHAISTDPSRLDRDLIHRFLSQEAYWSMGIPRTVVERSIDHSIPFGLYEGSEQVGFARVVTDHSAFAYLADVFVLESHRGKGLGVWLVETILAHPDLQRLRTMLLFTHDAHGLYRRFGFQAMGEERVRQALTLSRGPEELYGSPQT